MRSHLTSFLPILGVVLLFAGCRAEAPAPSAADPDPDLATVDRFNSSPNPWTTFYPLAIGTHWHSVRGWSLRFAGDGPQPWPDEYGGEEWDQDQICMEQRGAARYVVERRFWKNAEGDSGSEYVRSRQDSTGLYEAAVCICEVPNCIESGSETRTGYRDPSDVLWESIAPRYKDPLRRAEAKRAWDTHFAKLAAVRGVADLAFAEATSAAELTRLKYPLFPGQSWYIRAAPSFQAIVEAKETVTLDFGSIQAYRVRIVQPVDPTEIFDVFQWWGPCGMVRFATHSEFEILDENGYPFPYTWDEDRQVTDIDLVGLRACSFVRE